MKFAQTISLRVLLPSLPTANPPPSRREASSKSAPMYTYRTDGIVITNRPKTRDFIKTFFHLAFFFGL